ncbi:MAG: hypothetical protein ACKVZ0_04910 [Gemmatimonadales bacterium]
MQLLSREVHNRPSFAKVRHVLAVGGLLVGGCSSFGPSEVALPYGAVAMAANPAYQAWFDRTQACSGLRGTLQAVRWYVVPGVETFETPEGPKVGMWEKSGGVSRIIIAGGYLNHEMVVRHEMLHHLLDREGHPSEFFTSRCRLTWESWGQIAGQ